MRWTSWIRMEAQTRRTVTGGFDAYGHMVTIKTFDYSFDVTVYFAAFETFRRNVLGRRGWLDQVQPGVGGV